jgi:hypothetical protein
VRHSFLLSHINPIPFKDYAFTTSKNFCCDIIEGFLAKEAILLAKTVTAGPIDLYTAGLVGPKIL